MSQSAFLLVINETLFPYPQLPSTLTQLHIMIIQSLKKKEFPLNQSRIWYIDEVDQIIIENDQDYEAFLKFYDPEQNEQSLKIFVLIDPSTVLDKQSTVNTLNNVQSHENKELDLTKLTTSFSILKGTQIKESEFEILQQTLLGKIKESQVSKIQTCKNQENPKKLSKEAQRELNQNLHLIHNTSDCEFESLDFIKLDQLQMEDSRIIDQTHEKIHLEEIIQNHDQQIEQKMKKKSQQFEDCQQEQSQFFSIENEQDNLIQEDNLQDQKENDLESDEIKENNLEESLHEEFEKSVKNIVNQTFDELMKSYSEKIYNDLKEEIQQEKYESQEKSQIIEKEIEKEQEFQKKNLMSKVTAKVVSFMNKEFKIKTALKRLFGKKNCA